MDGSQTAVHLPFEFSQYAYSTAACSEPEAGDVNSTWTVTIRSLTGPNGGTVAGSGLESATRTLLIFTPDEDSGLCFWHAVQCFCETALWSAAFRYFQTVL